MMNRSSNYDTKSSILSIDYKIPYEISQGSRIVQHLQQSQEQLQFLKMKLTEAYQKIQQEIKWNIQITQNNQELLDRIKSISYKLEVEEKQNQKLKEIMETVIKNRKLTQEWLQYTHKRYKKIIIQQQMQFNNKIQQLQRNIKKMKKQNQTLQQTINQLNKKQINTNSKNDCQKQRYLQQKIQILEFQIKKLTNQKVTEVSRLKHQIECYQKSSMSPMRSSYIQSKPMTVRPAKVQYYDAESTVTNQNNINCNNIQQNSTIIQQSKVTSVSTSKTDHQDSISKWQKPRVAKNAQLTDDQKLTRAQIQKKKIQNQLMKIQRLKRHAPEDRQAMQNLQKKMYQIDSQISGLKRRIRQKY